MSKLLQEVTTIVGKYTDANGQEKNRYQRIGSIIETKKGPMLKIDNIPVCDPPWGGWAYLNTPKEKSEKDDDIGF
jgi:hypothetical protein